MEKDLLDQLAPQEVSPYAPNKLQFFALGIMFVLMMLSFAAANVQALLWMKSDWLVGTVLPAVIVDLTNEERGQDSLGSLTRNATLDEAARLKAEDMAAKEYFAHDSPEGVSPWYWFNQVGYEFHHAGENLAVHFTDSDEVVEAWMDSPGHRANILNGKYTEIGVGTAKGSYKGHDTVFVVQLFATPALTSKNTQIAEAVPTFTEPITVEPTAPVSSEEVPVVEGEESVPQAEEIVLPDTVQISEVLSENAPEVLVSDLATVSREDSLEAQVSLFDRTATQPSSLLQILYMILALIVSVSLITSIVLEWKRQRPLQLAYGGGLLVMMFILFEVHTALTGGATIL